eukprot:UN03148
MQRVISIIQGAEYIDNNDIFLIDDLVHTGGTLRNTVLALYKDYKPRTVNLFVTHAVFENNTEKQFLELYEQGLIHKFYICNTTTKAYQLDGCGPFEMLDLTDDLAELLFHNKHLSYEKLCALKLKLQPSTASPAFVPQQHNNMMLMGNSEANVSHHNRTRSSMGSAGTISDDYHYECENCQSLLRKR